MIYIYYVLGIAFIIYDLVYFKKRPNDNAFNRYYNSRYYRIVILVIFGIVALIISFFVKRQ
ncbi:hypothetical protein PMI10_02883 [Flavobacterium sp. CF136]|nr:hypothetical protein PMI10_02883 [Flavobacterium sp. CF136]